MRNKSIEKDVQFWIFMIAFGSLPLFIIIYMLTRIVRICNDFSDINQRIILIKPLLLVMLEMLIVLIALVLMMRNRVKIRKALGIKRKGNGD